MLDKRQKRVCRTTGSSLTASLEPLAHCGNDHLNWLNWFNFLILVGDPLNILIDLCFVVAVQSWNNQYGMSPN